MIAAVTDLSIQQVDEDLNEKLSQNAINLSQKGVSNLKKKESMVSIISNLTYKGQGASPKRNQRSQSQFNKLQKSISEALQNWNYDELMMA